MNTAEKIKVMQAFEDGKTIKGTDGRSGKGCKFSNNDTNEPDWNWEDMEYFVEPETLEEAANRLYGAGIIGAALEGAFIDGAKWQQEQSGESDD